MTRVIRLAGAAFARVLMAAAPSVILALGR